MDNEQAIDAGVQDAPVTQQPVNVQPETVAAEPVQERAERTFTQAQMNAVAAREARKAEERAEARLRAEYEARLSQQQPQQQAQNVGGIPQMTQQDLQRVIREEAYNMSRQHQAAQIEQDWLGAMDAERQADPGFAELYDATGIENHPNLILAMSGLENKAKVVKDLGNNPSKYANILMLANGGSPKLAERELKKLSASIRANEEAKAAPKVDAPLSQIRASNIGGDDGNYSNMSVSDFKAQSWLRG